MPPALLKSTNGLGLLVAPSTVVVPAAIDTAGALVDAGDAEERHRLREACDYNRGARHCSWRAGGQWATLGQARCVATAVRCNCARAKKARVRLPRGPDAMNYSLLVVIPRLGRAFTASSASLAASSKNNLLWSCRACLLPFRFERGRGRNSKAPRELSGLDASAAIQQNKLLPLQLQPAILQH